MPRRTGLTDIRKLTDNPVRDRRDTALRLGGYTLSLAAFLLILFSGFVVWDARNYSHFPDPVFALIATATVVTPVIVAAIVMRRVGRDMAPMLAVIAPVVVWLIVICFVTVTKALDGKNVF